MKNRVSGIVLPLRPVTSDAHESSDADLLELIREGDHEAYAILVRRHNMRFYRVAYRFLRSRTDAEDTVQDAFIKLWEKPGMWRSDKNTAFTTWFYRIVINQCMDIAKKKRPLQLVNEEQIEDGRMAHEEMMITHEKQNLLERQIAKLPERQRAALNLCFYEGLSNQDAADAMGLRLKALQSLLMRAKATLKEELKYLIEV